MMTNVSPPRRLLALGLIAAGAALAGMGLGLITRHQRAVIDRLNAEHTAMTAKLAAVGSRLHASAALKGAAVDNPPNSNARKSARVRSAAQQMNHAYNPEAAVSHRAATRIRLTEQYRPFFRSQHLTDDQIQKLMASIAGGEEDHHEIIAAAQAKSIAPTSADFVQVVGPLLTENQKATVQAESEILGPMGLDALKHYQQQLPVRSLLGEFAGQEALAGTPLSTEQADQLVGIVAGASSSYQKGSLASKTDIDWSSVNHQAASILTPQQLAVFTGAAPDSKILAGRVWSQFNQSLYNTLAAENSRH